MKDNVTVNSDTRIGVGVSDPEKAGAIALTKNGYGSCILNRVYSSTFCAYV